jgi:hypothetical protein
MVFTSVGSHGLAVFIKSALQRLGAKLNGIVQMAARLFLGDVDNGLL